MKIAHVVDSMEVGGAEILVSQMCRLQREQGHDPRIYSVATLGALGKQLQSEGFVVQPNVGEHLLDTSRNFFSIFKENPPDVVHLHNPTPTIYAAPAARFAGVSSIVSTRHSLVAPPHNRVQELKYAIAARFCNWIVGICDATTNNLKNLPGLPVRKIVRVYNGSLPLLRSTKELWPPTSGFTLVFVGRLEPVKNHPLMLSAFRSALSSQKDLKLWVVGDGRERERLEKLAAELGITRQVTFWGQQLDVAPFFSAADAFIMSSESEGLPMSLLQAFSLGLPAIVTDVGGMAEVVRLAQAGITVPLAPAEEMAMAIQRLAGSDGLRKQFSMNAEAAFQSRFTLEIMVDRYMDLYRTALKDRPVANS
jgi:glycosyltransferase involved in cell wall biosynthesis